MLVGEQLGRYEIAELIGTGGMGEVYLAKDQELGRRVALKVLRPEFCKAEDRVKRFVFEAKAVSGLNHPGIITIHEIVQPEDRLFIAMEFVEGETLRDKIERKRLDPHQALLIAEQVADALSVSHTANIIHRDIKPENIMVREDGIAKILDFGLAKPLFAGANDLENSDLLVETQPGLVIGSVRYMSPEQARGKQTDDGTDIWSLGVVLYEMIVGENPFEGDSVSDQLAAVIYSEPGELEQLTPEIGRIIEKCLKKDREDRYENIRDLAKELHAARLALEFGKNGYQSDELPATVSLPRHDTSESKTLIHRTFSSEDTSGVKVRSENLTRIHTIESWIGSRLFSVSAVVMLAAFTVGAWYLVPGLFVGSGPSFDSIQVSRLTDEGDAGMAAVSPDGKLVAFAEVSKPYSRLVVKQVATGTEVEIVPQSERSFLQPRFSHDGEFIYYVAKVRGVGTLYRVSALGGESKEIAVDIDSRPAISHDDVRIAFIRHDPDRGGDKVILVNSGGENLTQFLETKEIGFNKIHDVIWSHDGERLIIAGQKESDAATRLTKLIAIDLNTRSVVEEPSVSTYESEEWSYAHGFESLKGDSGLVFVGKKNIEDAIQVWHLDATAGKIKPVTTDTSDYQSVSVSHDGKVLIATKMEWSSGLVSFDPVSRDIREVKANTKNFYGRRGIAETADGSVIYPLLDSGAVNLYRKNIETGEETRLTTDSRTNLQPAVSPLDGSIVFASDRGQTHGLWKMDADGQNPERLTEVENGRDVDPAFINDGKTVVFTRQRNDGGRGTLMKVSLEGGDASELLPDARYSNMMVRVSPDMKKIAFVEIVYDEKNAKLHSTIRIGDVNGEKVTMTGFEKDAGNRDGFEWSPTSDSLMMIRKDGATRLWEFPIDGSPETEKATFNTGDVRSFFWARDGKRIFLVRGVESNDLVLVRSIESD